MSSTTIDFLYFCKLQCCWGPQFVSNLILHRQTTDIGHFFIISQNEVNLSDFGCLGHQQISMIHQKSWFSRTRESANFVGFGFIWTTGLTYCLSMTLRIEIITSKQWEITPDSYNRDEIVSLSLIENEVPNRRNWSPYAQQSVVVLYQFQIGPVSCSNKTPLRNKNQHWEPNRNYIRLKANVRRLSSVSGSSTKRSRGSA